LHTALRSGTSVYITFLPNVGYEGTVSTARRVAAEGMRPVPHLAARAVHSEAELDELLEQLVAGAGVARVLVIAGSLASPAGPYASTMDLLRTGLLQRHGLRAVGVAGHPEGTPDVPPADLAAALVEKNELALEAGLDMELVTQFCFAPEPLVAWERAVREAGSRLPVRVGLPGAASAATLVRFGIRCGVGPSLTVMRKRAGSVLKLATARRQYPEATAVGVARASVADPSTLFSAFHYFPFGGFSATAAWANSLRQGRFGLAPNDRILVG
jgi:methylenetetrahydrofolate reductase (NADPH)